MAEDATLAVLPGYTVTDETNVDAAVLNALARPTVSVPAGSLPPDVLQLGALLTALLAAGGDTLRGRSFLTKGNFWAEDWVTPEGSTVAAGGAAENAAEWTLAPVGGPVSIARAQDSPDALSTWCAQLTGGAGVTAVDFYTFVPSGIAGSLRDATLTFSAWVKNLYSTTAQANACISPASDLNSRSSVILADNSALQTFASGVWTRLVWTFDTAGMSNLANGFRIGIRTSALDSPLKSLLIAQAQLEAATVASSFIRPAASGAGSGLRVPVMTVAERARGFQLLAQLSTGEWRTMANPLGADAFVGFNPQIGAPVWSNDNFVAVDFSGTDQVITVPPGVTEMEVHCWGSGASTKGGRPGGVGGYTWGRFAVTAGDKLTAVVGAAGVFAPGAPGYGFGGSVSSGGLTGLFTGEAPVTASDAARALAVAGGGGGCPYDPGYPASPETAGGNGNDPTSSGGELTFLGAAVRPPNGQAGGGGYYGGSALGDAGRGGAGYLHTDATAGLPLYTVRVTPVYAGMRIPVPGNTSPYYADEAGQSGRDGRLVIIWNPPAL